MIFYHLRRKRVLKLPHPTPERTPNLCFIYCIGETIKKGSAIFGLILLILAIKADAQTISITAKQESLRSVMDKIEKQTGYDFWYNKNTLNEQAKISLDQTENTLEKALRKIAELQDLRFEIIDKTIFLKPKSKDKISPSAEQRMQISGRVVDSEGNALANITISIKGTGMTRQTDESGKFTFTGVDKTGILIATSIGYGAREIKFTVQDLRPMLIVLQLAENKLDEVQINAGYYSVKEKERTGTITRIDSKTIAQQPVSNPLATLQGRVSGLLVTQRNGLPGSDFTVQIRGRSSIQSGTAPLYLIDGVPFPSESLNQNSQLAVNSPLSSLNPADIESIEVLKDADATAIYGSRGANGVILITTKKAKAGRTTVELNLSAGAGKATRIVEMMNTQEYLLMRREAFMNDKVAPTVANAPDLLSFNPEQYQNFPDLLIGGTARIQNAQFRLSSGSPSTSFTFGAHYYKETTVFPGDNGINRKDANINIIHSSEDKRFNANFSASYGTVASNFYLTDMTSAVTASPNTPALLDNQGKLNWMENGISFLNPLATTFEPNEFKTNRFNGNAVLRYMLLPNLEIKTTGGISNMNANQFSASPLSAQNPAASPTGYATFGDNMNQTWIVEPQINYTTDHKQLGTLSILIGGTWQENTAKGTLVQASGYTNDLLIRSVAAAPTRNPSNTFAEYRYQALFARINYNLQGKYLLNLTGRRDGSSRFGPGRRFANFGAIGAAWIFSSESWLTEAVPFLSFGKLRGSIGITGNDQISNYQYLDSYLSTIPYGGQSGLFPSKLFNENYGWESNRKLELNIELGFLRDRIRISAGTFSNISSNQLISYSLAGQTGFNNILRNLDAKIRNRGLELEINSVNVRTKHFIWSSNANFTFSRNKLISFPNLSSSSYANTYIIGQSLGIIQGYSYTGINPVTGLYEFRDKNGDGQINISDYSVIGTKEPIVYGGVGNSIQYKGFSLDIFFQFSKQKGSDIVFGAANLAGNRNNQPRIMLDRWTPDNPNGKYQAFSQSVTGPFNQTRTLMRNSDAALVDASFIRLKNLALSYSIDEKLMRKIGLKSLKFSLQGQNLLTVSPYEGIDPESQSASTLPPLKVLSLGMQLTL